MKDFNQMIGHENIIQHLQNAIQSKKVSHAYIFHGEEGAGKKLLASVFAKTLQCTECGILPCDRCTSCMQVETENHPDIFWVTHEKVSIGVDDIRIQINSDVQIKPYQSPYKIYIMDSADKMTESAQNALLKTLEEPPDYAVIILLVSNISTLLPTILSRCVRLDFKPINKQVIKKFLMLQKGVPDYKAELAADFSGGNVGKAITYASSEEFEEMKEQVMHLLKRMEEMEIHEVVSSIKAITQNKDRINDTLDFLVLWYRDLLILKATNDPNLLLYKEEYGELRKQADRISYEGIEKSVEVIDKTKYRLKANVNFDVAIELMLFVLKENSND